MGQARQLRRLALLAAGGAIAVNAALHYGDSAAGSGPGTPDTGIAPQASAAPAAATRAGAAAPQPGLLPPLREQLSAEPSGDLFASMSWLPPAPPPPPPKLAAAEPPQAPPLPYRFVGMIEDRARPAAFLARGAELFIVGAGDTIEGQYRVDKLTPQEISLTYLPLNQAQQIPIGEE